MGLGQVELSSLWSPPISQVTELVASLSLHPCPKRRPLIVLAECCATRMWNPEARGPPKPSPANSLKVANSMYVFSPYEVTKTFPFAGFLLMALWGKANPIICYLSFLPDSSPLSLLAPISALPTQAPASLESSRFFCPLASSEQDPLGFHPQLF